MMESKLNAPFLLLLSLLVPEASHAEPVTLLVNFSVEVCVLKGEHGAADCEFNLGPSERVQLDNGNELPALWSAEREYGGHGFSAEVGVVRHPDGDRLIFRTVISPEKKPLFPAYAAVKLSDWRKMEQFLFEPQPLQVGKVQYLPHLRVYAAKK